MTHSPLRIIHPAAAPDHSGRAALCVDQIATACKHRSLRRQHSVALTPSKAEKTAKSKSSTLYVLDDESGTDVVRIYKNGGASFLRSVQPESYGVPVTYSVDSAGTQYVAAFNQHAKQDNQKNTEYGLLAFISQCHTIGGLCEPRQAPALYKHRRSCLRSDGNRNRILCVSQRAKRRIASRLIFDDISARVNGVKIAGGVHGKT
jgi:hypothetical protein